MAFKKILIFSLCCSIIFISKVNAASSFSRPHGNTAIVAQNKHEDTVADHRVATHAATVKSLEHEIYLTQQAMDKAATQGIAEHSLAVDLDSMLVTLQHADNDRGESYLDSIADHPETVRHIKRLLSSVRTELETHSERVKNASGFAKFVGKLFPEFAKKYLGFVEPLEKLQGDFYGPLDNDSGIRHLTRQAVYHSIDEHPPKADTLRGRAAMLLGDAEDQVKNIKALNARITKHLHLLEGDENTRTRIPFGQRDTQGEQIPRVQPDHQDHPQADHQSDDIPRSHPHFAISGEEPR